MATNARTIELLCHECGHMERGDASRTLMLKIRMWNHINHDHPSLIERFRDVVETNDVAEVSPAHRSAQR
ncbi:MAG: hypothetical protein KGI70_02060 [Patescibacteria group bacterium]|nr:hypothetical protein [Patescibacteria group bacterium]